MTSNAKRTTLWDGEAPAWTGKNSRDEAPRPLVNTNPVDNGLDRTDMPGNFKQTSQDGQAAAHEFKDLKAIVNTVSLFGTLRYVGVLTKDVVLVNVANKRDAGATLGNLAAGSSLVPLDKFAG